ncbi:hypothetical protein O1611_g8299 [Lasiodiplodia mahajangana]|uniref:Uncharacterized protein n=1 Tax=Lasiodiplodia mahajangana TaxID=1108764 RepID=A0ACC2JD82_9PEZI|nr:hypothetical protein O1611_g8299 [Lasiodiplodia mahajangana]
MFGSRSSSKEHRFLEGQVSALRELNLFNPSDSRSLRSVPKKQEDWSSTNSGPSYTEKSESSTWGALSPVPSSRTVSSVFCLTRLGNFEGYRAP